ESPRAVAAVGARLERARTAPPEAKNRHEPAGAISDVGLRRERAAFAERVRDALAIAAATERVVREPSASGLTADGFREGGAQLVLDTGLFLEQCRALGGLGVRAGGVQVPESGQDLPVARDRIQR